MRIDPALALPIAAMAIGGTLAAWLIHSEWFMTEPPASFSAVAPSPPAAPGPGIVRAADTRVAAGDPKSGARVFRACAACHSLQPGRQMTGPSLAGLWNRRAGSDQGFPRYSTALKSADITWNAETLDAWLADPVAFIPGNRMTFPGIKQAQARADIIAFLEDAGSGATGSPDDSGGMMGDMMDGMTGGTMGGTMSSGSVSLKALEPAQQVLAIQHCGDSYFVSTADGETEPFWERNLRFKTDTSATGPQKGSPALLGAGMMGDRASIVFAEPQEIGSFIESTC